MVPASEMSKRPIEHLMGMGDSLTDRGLFEHRQILGFPLAPFAGLGKSPEGRFTNGYTWMDVLGTFFAEELIIRNLENKKGKRPDEISDAIITHQSSVERPLHQFNLDDPQDIPFGNNRNFILSYAEGGATAHNYRGEFGSLEQMFKEEVVSNLELQRHNVIKDAEYMAYGPHHKASTLVIEWSGANDLITIVSDLVKQRDGYLSEAIMDRISKALAARVENIEVLVAQGYKNFVLFNMPNLSLTPRFQRDNPEAIASAARATTLFNERLSELMRELKAKFAKSHPEVQLDVFDVNHFVEQAYQHPEDFDLDPDKLTQPFTQSKDYKGPDHSSTAEGYMFWDDLHPAAGVHAQLANKFYQSDIFKQYSLHQAHDSLVQQFREAYGSRWEQDTGRWLGHWRSTSNIEYLNKDLSLETILRHAFLEDGKRSFNALKDLHWIDDEGRLISDNPSLLRAMSVVKGDIEAVVKRTTTVLDSF